MLKQYFSLTSSERNGLFALFILALGLFLFIKIRQTTYAPELVDLSTLQDSVQQFYDSPRMTAPAVKKYKNYPEYKTTSSYSSKKLAPKKSLPPVVVEINSATAKELTQIRGVGEFYAKNIVEERLRLGGFTHLEQLLSVYGMTDDKLKAMSAQITIDTTLCLAELPLNSADSTQLAEEYVIDTYLASRIVRYRERLGGFYDTHQLLEIFSIDDDTYQSLMQRLFLDTIMLRYLDINNDDFMTIMKHPYINGYKNTKAIFRYLDFGGITTWEEFCKIPNLRLENPEGLKYYVKFLPVRPKAEVADSVITEVE